MTDYRKFKTPYYEIEVSDSTGQRMVKLPHHIMRLVDKVEITEAYVADTATSVMTIDFIEGSREPASTDKNLGTDGLYKISTDGVNPDFSIAGSLTNRSGIITDLRFSGNNGITFLTSSEKKAGKIDNTPQDNIVEDIVTRTHKKENSRPTFLFQERNQIRVTWGYLEDSSSKRSIRGYITIIQTTFPENGQVRTSISCQPTNIFLDQITPIKGVPFGKRTIVKGNSIVEFTDNETSALLHTIAKDGNMAAIISPNLLGPQVDNGKQKMWIAGESFTQFMTRLAEIHNCYFNVIPDPKTGKDTLIFIKKADFESRLVIADKTLTAYKAPGSIIKNISIKADFGSLFGSLHANVDNKGNPTGKGNDNGSTESVQFKATNGKIEQMVPISPINQGNPVPAAVAVATKIAKGGVTGKLEVNPTNSKDRLQAQSLADAEKLSRNIILEFTTLGYSKFTPGVIEFSNIGVRYSGKYRLQTVTHTIDSNGYTTKGTAVSFALATGGVTTVEAPKAGSDPKQVNVQQFAPAAPVQTGAQNLTIDQYHKFLGIV